MGNQILLVLLTVSCLMTTCSSCDSSTIKRISVYPQDDEVSCEFVDTINTSVSDLEVMVTNCSIVYFCSHQLLLNESVRLANLHDVTFIGLNETVIDCNGLHGFEFMNMTDLKVKALEFSKCVGTRSMLTLNNHTFPFEAGIHINGSTNLAFINVTVSNSTGMGMSVFEIRGSVIFSGCTFRNNGKTTQSRGSTGIFIYLSSNHTVHDSSIKFDHCHFVGNHAYEIDQKSTPFGRGGGLRIYINSASSNNVSIDHCSFSDNIASRWGGGLFMSLHDSSKDNLITIQDTNFNNNTSLMGGGATSFSFQCDCMKSICFNNTFLFQLCLFLNNSAVYGGGSHFSSIPISNTKYEYNQMKYIDCTWMHNSAQFGSAIIILSGLYSEGVRPTLEFEDCTIMSNNIRYKNLSGPEPPAPFRQKSVGVGALYCTLHDVKFIGKLNVTDNNGSAILTSSCDLSFQEHSMASFHDNTGYFGGALYLLGVSTISIQPNSLFKFINNAADADGGAIYYKNSDIFEHNYSHSCFIRINRTTGKNISFIFSDNHAGIDSLAKTAQGQSVYALSFSPCVREYSNSSTIFNNFRNNDVSTDVSTFMTSNFESENFIPVIPGKPTKIPFEGHDDLGHSRSEVYRLTLKKDLNSSIDVDDEFNYIAKQRIKVYGRPGDEATIVLTTLNQYKISLVFEIQLEQCPPGYILLNDRSCVCSAESKTPYIGILRCDNDNFRAYREDGYWYGYDNEKGFITGYCRVGACSHSKEPLPAISNASLLSAAVCEASRIGIMCSECVNGTSVHYHSPTFKCGGQDKCHLGWLFYILSELIPVTLVFIIVIAFNISFTSGLASGFILYAQIIHSFQVSIHDAIPNGGIEVLNKINYLIYSMFNLEFFNIDELSFCLMKTDSILNLLAVQYATILYSFLLILLIVFMLRVCDTRRTKSLFKLRAQKIRTSIIPGMSAFLILCYAQCVKITYYFLSSSSILGLNGKQVKIVVYTNGKFEWFGPEHLKYAIPAVVIGVLVMSIPMILFLLYPLCNKILACLKIEDTKYVKIICKIVPIQRLQPFLDSFESCFKDNCRFFSGLYFLYRVIMLANLVLNYMKYFYIVLEVQLIVMLVLHAVAQPYKERRYNIIDSLLFAHMALINALTMFNFTSKYRVVASIQSVLIALPLVCALLYCGWRVAKALRKTCFKSNPPANVDFLDYAELLHAEKSEQEMQQNEVLLSRPSFGNRRRYTYGC